MMLQVTWQKCQGGIWCPLANLDLSGVSVTGVYMIWHPGQPSRVVRVGQGEVTDRLSAHRNDPIIMQYAKYGPLLVTWAAVPAYQLDGVERYLADTWHPLIGDAFPDAAPIAVNSPWS